MSGLIIATCNGQPYKKVGGTGGTNTLCSLTFLHKYIILTKALTGGKDLSFSYTQKILVLLKAGEVHPKFTISSVVKILFSSSKIPCLFAGLVDVVL